jgi:transcriptional regulator with XRE-family HTH domain
MTGGGTFGSLLRHYRAAANLTQEELAERSGMSVQAIGALERGDRRSPRPSTVECLAEALKLDSEQKQVLVAAAHWKPASETRRNQDSEPGPDATGPADVEALLASLPADVLPDRAPLPTGSRMPLAPNPLFVGRGDELLQVAAALKGGDTVALGQVVASTGLGGLGKTQLTAWCAGVISGNSTGATTGAPERGGETPARRATTRAR